jgi:thioesterase domain-containing protein
MAQQLHQAGEEIALLALIDEPPATGFRFSNAFRFIATVFLPTVWPYVFEYFQLLAGRGPKVGNRGESQNGEKGAVLTGRKESAGGAGSWLAEALRVMRVTQVNLQAGHSYSPQPYPGHVTLFRTTYAAYGENRHLPDLGWQALAQGGLEIHPMPGRHFNLLRKPHVQVLAGQLRSCIDTAVNQHQGLNLGHRVHQPPASQILQRGEATTNR